MFNKGSWLGFSLGIALLSAPLFGQDQGLERPGVKKSFAIYEKTENLINNSDNILMDERPFDNCAEGEDAYRRVFLREGEYDDTVLKYFRSRVEGDVETYYSYFYDEDGVLRMALIEATRETSQDSIPILKAQVFFDRHGHKILEDRQELQPEAKDYPNPFPETLMIREPRQAFDGENGTCEEIPVEEQMN